MTRRPLLLGLASLFACLSVANLVAADNPSPTPGPVDNQRTQQSLESLFDEPSPTPTPVATAPSPSPSPEPILDEIANFTGIKFFGSTSANLGFSAGWSDIPKTSQPFSELLYYGGVEAKTSLGFEFRPTDDFRIRGSARAAYPNPTVDVPELFMDYSIEKAVFFRIGLFGYGWGYARYLRLDDLPSRMIDGKNTGIEFNLKTSLPIGQGGLTLLARAREGYFNAWNEPRPHQAGYGLLAEIETGPLEWELGAYYQAALTKRMLLGVKTSVGGFDLFGEMTLGVQTWAPLVLLPTVTLGAFWEPSKDLRFYAEYAYNGERPSTTALVADAVALRGHNSIVGMRISHLGDLSGRISLAWQQNFTDGSAFISPLFDFSPLAHVNLQVGLPLLVGTGGSYLMDNRPIPGSMGFGLFVLASFSLDY